MGVSCPWKYPSFRPQIEGGRLEHASHTIFNSAAHIHVVQVFKSTMLILQNQTAKQILSAVHYVLYLQKHTVIYSKNQISFEKIEVCKATTRLLCSVIQII